MAEENKEHSVRELVEMIAERRQLTNEQTISGMIVDNNHLRSFLLTLPAAKRREAYYALKPLLDFKPKPLLLLLTKRIPHA